MPPAGRDRMGRSFIGRILVSVSEDRAPQARPITVPPSGASPTRPARAGRLRRHHLPAVRRITPAWMHSASGLASSSADAFGDDGVLSSCWPGCWSSAAGPGVRRYRVLDLRRLLDRHRPVAVLVAPHATARQATHDKGWILLDLRHLQHVHAGPEHPGQHGRFRRVPDPGLTEVVWVHRPPGKRSATIKARRDHRGRHRRGGLVRLGRRRFNGIAAGRLRFPGRAAADPLISRERALTPVIRGVTLRPDSVRRY